MQFLLTALSNSTLQSPVSGRTSLEDPPTPWVLSAHTHLPHSATGSLCMFPSVAARTSSSKQSALRKKTRAWRQGKITDVSFSSTFWETKEASRDQPGELLFSSSVAADSLWPHGLQHARLPCPSLSPRACSNSCPLSQWCHPTISSSVVPFSSWPSIFPSIKVFSIESVVCIRWPKYWSFSFSPSNEYSGLISLRIDWLDLLADQGTLKSLLQHCSSKASILPCSAFFIVQLSHPYMTTGENIALTRWTFFGKVMSLLFNI